MKTFKIIVTSLLFIVVLLFTGCTTRDKSNVSVTEDYITNLSAKEYFEKVATNCSMQVVEPTKQVNTYNYETTNTTTGLQVNCNDKDEIYYIKVYALSENNKDDFINACNIFGDYRDDEFKESVEKSLKSGISTLRRKDGLKLEINYTNKKATLEISTENGITKQKNEEKGMLN